MLSNEQGRAVTKKYLTVAKAMRENDEMVMIILFNITFNNMATSHMSFCIDIQPVVLSS
jgi:hypothetical protein